MVKGKYEATFEGITVTRSTDRVYTHVIMVKDRLHPAVCGNCSKMWNYKDGVTIYCPTYAADVKRSNPRDRCTFSHHHTCSDIDFIPQKEDDKSPEWGALTWCGRPDLALKAESSALKDWACVARVPVVKIK